MLQRTSKATEWAIMACVILGLATNGTHAADRGKHEEPQHTETPRTAAEEAIPRATHRPHRVELLPDPIAQNPLQTGATQTNLIETDHNDPEKVLMTSDRMLRANICTTDPTEMDYDQINDPCDHSTRSWKFAPGLSTGFASTLSALILPEDEDYTMDSLYIPAGISVRLYQGSNRTSPLGPLLIGPTYISTDHVIIWGGAEYEPNTIAVPGTTGNLSNYTIDINPDYNNNGIVDQCDTSCSALTVGGTCGTVYSGTCGISEDCNANGVPDIAEWYDLNDDGVLDDCQRFWMHTEALPLLPDGSANVATALPVDAGTYTIAGYADDGSGRFQAVYWLADDEDPYWTTWAVRRAGPSVDMNESYAYDVEDSTLAGTIEFADGSIRAFSSNAGNLSIIPSEFQENQMIATGINIWGEMIGTQASNQIAWGLEAFRYRPGAVRVESLNRALRPLMRGWPPRTPESFRADPRGINERGQIVGTFVYDPTESDIDGYQAVLWESDNTASRLVPFFVGFDAPQTWAENLNDAGEIAGHLQYLTMPRRPFFWNADRTWVYLEQPIGTTSHIHGMNNRGWVAGANIINYQQKRAVLWHRGKLIDLNDWLPPDSPWTLKAAYDINDDFQVVGEGIYQGQRRAFFIYLPISQSQCP